MTTKEYEKLKHTVRNMCDALDYEIVKALNSSVDDMHHEKIDKVIRNCYRIPELLKELTEMGYDLNDTNNENNVYLYLLLYELTERVVTTLEIIKHDNSSKEMTVEEIEKELGYKVKIVDKKEKKNDV